MSSCPANARMVKITRGRCKACFVPMKRPPSKDGGSSSVHSTSLHRSAPSSRRLV